MHPIPFERQLNLEPVVRMDLRLLEKELLIELPFLVSVPVYVLTLKNLVLPILYTALVYLSEYYQLNEVASFWEQVVSLNDYQMERYVKRILQAMFNTLVDKKLAVLGFAFKPDTGDTRDAPAIYICKRLLEEKACLRITDPHALENARNDLQGIDNNVEYIIDPYKAAEGVHGIALITDWAEYSQLDYQKIFDKMEKPAFIFDGRNHLNHRELFDIGFNVYAVGKAPLTHI